MGFDVGSVVFGTNPRLDLISARHRYSDCRREIKERGEQIVRLCELLKLALDYIPRHGPELRQEIEAELKKMGLRK
jgi:hypothetical protein